VAPKPGPYEAACNSDEATMRPRKQTTNKQPYS
jgi:hypothetical protein